MHQELPRLLVFFSGAVSIDQASKYLLPARLNNAGSFSVSMSNTMLSILAAMTLMLLIFALWKSMPVYGYEILTIILAGGASNLVDRLSFGGIRDVFTIGGLYFNLADIYVVAGLALLVCAMVKPLAPFIDKQHGIN